MFSYVNLQNICDAEKQLKFKNYVLSKMSSPK